MTAREWLREAVLTTGAVLGSACPATSSVGPVGERP